MKPSSTGGLIAEFDRPEALVAAARRAQQAGYRHVEAFSPFPLLELRDILGYRTRFLPYVPLAAALVGGAVQYCSQYWMNVVDYPINIGGRPMHSWPGFVPSTIIVALLWAGIATFITALVSARLLQPHHPVFDVPDFECASQDRFFLWIMANDPSFHPDGTKDFLAALSPRAVREVPE